MSKPKNGIVIRGTVTWIALMVLIVGIIVLFGLSVNLSFSAGLKLGQIRGLASAEYIVMDTIHEVERAEDNLGTLTYLFGGKDSCDYAKRILLRVQREIKSEPID